jgi:toxin ParE1/3/4
MRRHKVEFLRRAQADLFQLYDQIAEQAGLDVAGAYIDRIEEACRALEFSPLRGRQRDDVLSGLRTIGFERRIAIVFRVRRFRVSIVRILYGGRDLERVLRQL